MNIKEFAEKSKDTMLYPTKKEKVTCLTLGIFEEIAEVEEECLAFYGKELGKAIEGSDYEKIRSELGDLAFYVYGLSCHYGYIPFGETGECFDFETHAPILSKVIKKTVRDNDWEITNPDYRDKFQFVIETLHCYILNICEEFNFNLSDVLSYNVEKLQGRKSRGTLRGDGSNR